MNQKQERRRLIYKEINELYLTTKNETLEKICNDVGITSRTYLNYKKEFGEPSYNTSKINESKNKQYTSSINNYTSSSKPKNYTTDIDVQLVPTSPKNRKPSKKYKSSKKHPKNNDNIFDRFDEKFNKGLNF